MIIIPNPIDKSIKILISRSLANQVCTATAYKGNLIQTNPWLNVNKGSGDKTAEIKPVNHKAIENLNQFCFYALNILINFSYLAFKTMFSFRDENLMINKLQRNIRSILISSEML